MLGESMQKEAHAACGDLPAVLTAYLQSVQEETLELIEALCAIPAPSEQERERAVFCKNWLTTHGAEHVEIDAAGNVLYPVGCEGEGDIVLFAAHTDTVFPDTEPMPFRRDDTYLYAPGVGDDTTNLAVLLMIARYVAQNHLRAPVGILFAADSCEEGLGNLKGMKEIFRAYGTRIREMYSLDLGYDAIVNKCVGSHRYKITAETAGGHSFGAFGNPNAIAVLSDLVCRLYACDLPVHGDSRTTYNVGQIEGGTSVNTIAQKASMLYEYRSDAEEFLAEMQAFFTREIEKLRAEGRAKIMVETVGIRPCGRDVDAARLEQISRRAKRICEKHSGQTCRLRSGSTDCNIPMSMGIPAIAVGTYLGSGVHTREERVRIDSIPTGMRIAAELILGYFECI